MTEPTPKAAAEELAQHLAATYFKFDDEAIAVAAQSMLPICAKHYAAQAAEIEELKAEVERMRRNAAEALGEVADDPDPVFALAVMYDHYKQRADAAERELKKYKDLHETQYRLWKQLPREYQ